MPPDVRYTVGQRLYSHQFKSLENWRLEFENAAEITLKDSTLTLDTSAGATLWFKPRLEGPLMISFDVKQISAGGPNDRVSDTNVFWMATDTRSPTNFFATPRSGKFSDYDQLQTYYAGIGGNANTTTRFRRYIGQKDNRPLLPQHDLSDPASLLTPNRTDHLQLIAAGNLIQLWRNGSKLFELNDPTPYTTGHFAFRTTHSHQQFSNFQIHKLTPQPH